MANYNTPTKGFQKGKSGNPAGKPKGCLNKTRQLMREMVGDNREEIAQAIIDGAIGGKSTQLDIVRQYFVPRDIPGDFYPIDIEIKGTIQERINKVNELQNNRIIPSGEASIILSNIEKEQKILGTESQAEAYVRIREKQRIINESNNAES